MRKAWRARCSCGLAGALLVALAVSGFLAGPASAHISPAGCLNNDLSLSLSKDKSSARPGDTITYAVSVGNVGPGACDITGATVTLTLPAADGTATGTTVALGTNLTFLAGAAPTQVGLSQAYVVSVNAGVNSVTAAGSVTGVLHDAPGDDQAAVAKTVTSTITTAGLSTQVSPTPITLGASFHDTATVTAAPAGSPAPTGTVKFDVYSPGDTNCTGALAGTSTTAVNTPAGGPSTAVSGNFTPTLAGTFRVIARYSGDANYNPVTTACNDANEAAVVTPAPLPVTTQVAPTSLTLGSSFQDSATLGPVPAGQIAPTGTVTFNVYGPGDTTCSGPVLLTSTNPVNAAGTGAVSLSFTPASGPGTYRVIATYNGDANYSKTASGCGDVTEAVVVTLPNLPVIAVTKAASPPSEVEPGGTFTFTVQVSNPSTTTPVTITKLVDNIYGDLSTRAGSTCGALIGVVLAPGASSAPCTFTGPFTGKAGASQTDTVTVTGVNNGTTVTATAMATVTLTPAGPQIALKKTASPATLPAPGGTFTFTAVVSNPSTTTPVTITKLVDNIYGDLSTRAGSTCGTLIGVVLAPGASSAPCSFPGTFSGSGGASQTDVITVTGTNNGTTVTAVAQATVSLTPVSKPAALVSPVSLRVPAACVTKPFKVYVTGGSIAKVVFYLDGKRLATVSKRDSAGRFSITIHTAGLTKGKVHHVTAVTEPVPHSGQPVRTVRKTFAICGTPTVPRFTG